jgi:hypothetical protein
VSAGDPFLQVGSLSTDGGVGPVAGVDDRVLVKDQQPVTDRIDDGAEVGERAAGRAGTAREQGVAAEQPALAGEMEAHGAARMPGRVQDRKTGACHGDRLPVGKVAVRSPFGIGHVPQLPVGRMQPDRCSGGIGQGGGGIYVVVVGVRAQDGGKPARPDRRTDRVRVVRGVDDHALGFVTDDPDVVVDVPGAAVEGKRAGRDETGQGEHHSIMAERGAAPRPGPPYPRSPTPRGQRRG